MGVVVECTHLQLGGRFAIKMLRKDVLHDDDAVQRFTREAQAASKLKSEYVAKVTDVGVFENNVPFMVMEYLEGHDLGELLEQRGVLPVPWASELMMQTAEALAEAHSHGIVHRDVKPTNLFVTWRPDGSALVKVLDFGISKSPMGTDMQLTQTQSLLGTPAYMSPEQMRSARLVDTRSDIWSLGTVFYELLEGRRPFEAESFSEMCVKVAVDPPAPMVNTPPALQHVILKCLAKSPEQRYASMAELGRDLIPFVQDQHQGQRLVERMERVLRRSSGNQNPDVSGRMSVPMGTPNPDSSGARQWGAGSEPFAQPVQDRSAPVAMLRENSEPVTPVPYTMMESRPSPRRGLFIVVGVGLVVGAGVALAVALGGTEEAKKAPPPPPPSVASQPPAPVKADPPTPPVPQPPVKAEVPVAIEVKEPAKPPPAVAVKKSPASVKKSPSVKKDEPPPPPPIQPEVKDATVKPPEAKPVCDPFNSPHGCPTK